MRLENGLSREFNSKAAFLVIDVQKAFAQKTKYCDGNDETEEVSARIAKKLPAIRAAGIPVYFVCYRLIDAETDEEDLHKVGRLPGDKIIYKSWDSAFHEPALDIALRKEGIRHLLMSGFNYSCCVADTALDARAHGYDVTLMTDLSCDGIGGGKYFCDLATRKMERERIGLGRSGKVLPEVFAGAKAMPEAPSPAI